MTEDFWNIDVALGEALLAGEPYTLRARMHTNREEYHKEHEIVALRRTRGTQDYVLMHPYILVPDIRLTMGLYPQPTVPGVVGEVIDSRWEGMRHQRVGDGQAWYYREDKTLILWECTVFDHYRADNPLKDMILAALWSGFERWLLTQFPEMERLVTPAWEPDYETAQWRVFLHAQGYAQHSARAFLKVEREDTA